MNGLDDPLGWQAAAKTHAMKVLELQGLLREAYDHLEATARRNEVIGIAHTDLDFLLARIDVAIS